MFIEVLDFLAILVWSAETGRIGNVTHGGSGFADSLNDAGQILVVRTSGIFSVELHVLHIALGILHGSYSPLDNLFRGTIEFILDVRGAGTDTRMDTLMLGILQCLGSHVDILLHGTGQGTDSGPRHCFRDFYHRVEVSRTRNGESGFNHIHAQCFQLLGHLNLFYCVQLAARHLFTVAQRGVENE